MHFDQFTIAKSPQPCMFCGKVAEYYEIDNFERLGFYVRACLPCRARYVYFGDGKLASYSLYVRVKSRLFSWTVSTETNKAFLKHIEDYEKEYLDTNIVPPECLSIGMDVNGEVMFVPLWSKKENLLAIFPDAPSVNPQNVVDKVKTYLIFL